MGVHLLGVIEGMAELSQLFCTGGFWDSNIWGIGEAVAASRARHILR